jgi:glycerol-3-phosphate dehydrogenase
MELLRDACRLGACALNYAPVVEVVDEGRVARGVRVRDALTDAQHTITGRAVVNCAGPKVRSLAYGRGGDADGLFRPSLAFNLMLDRELPCRSALAVAAPEPGAPVLFVIPQDGMLLAGTMHAPRPPETTEAMPTDAELEQFLKLLNAAIPGLDAGRGNIRRVFAGLLPVTDPGGTNLAKREVLLDHGRRGGLQRLYSVSGVKWTTANDVARQVLGMIGAGAGAVDGCDELPLSPATRLLTQAGGLWDSDAAVLRPVLQQVIEEEAVQSLDDLVLRRSNWAATEPGLERVRQRVAEIMNGGLLEHR